MDLLPVLDAQRTALLAQLELVGSETNLLTSLVQLFKALGGGWDEAIGPREVIEKIDETGTAEALTVAQQSPAPASR